MLNAISKVVRIARAPAGVLGMLFAIYQLPRTVQELPADAEPWRKAWSMVDQNTALWVGFLALALWVIWIDVRPFVLARYGAARRIKQMRDLADKVSAFTLECQLATPNGRDSLNYLDPSLPSGFVEFGESARSSMATGPNADPFQVRMMRNAQEERLNYELTKRAEFGTRFEGAAIYHLRYAERKQLLDEQDIRTTHFLEAHYPIGASWEFYGKVAATLRVCAEKLENLT